MSPAMQALTARTADWAWVTEHGAAAEQAVPLPVGEVYSVAAVAAWETAGTPSRAPASVVTAARAAGRPVPRWGVLGAIFFLRCVRASGRGGVRR